MEILWSKAATYSLQEVLDYTFENYGSKQVEIIKNNILTAIERIATFPYSAPKLTQFSHRKTEYRCVVISRELKIIFSIKDVNTLQIAFVGIHEGHFPPL